jgi:hypothetical protein
MRKSAAASPLILAPGIVAVAIFVGYVFIWLAGARQMRTAVADWAEDHRSSGGDAKIGGFAARGFPFFLRGALSDVEVSAGALRLQAPAAFIDAEPFKPTRFVLSAREPFVVDFGGEGAWRVEAPGARASVARDKARGWLLDVEAGPSRLVRIDTEGLIVADAFLLSAAPSNVDRTRIFFGASAAAISFAEPGREFAFDAADLAFAVSGATSSATSLKAWRDGGGAVEIQNAGVTSGAGRAQIAGTLAIDAAGYPAGRLDAAIGDPSAFAAALAAAGVIRVRDIDNARTALSLIAIASGGTIEAPLTLEDGEAKVAGVRIGKLKPVIRGTAAAAQP